MSLAGGIPFAAWTWPFTAEEASALASIVSVAVSLAALIVAWLALDAARAQLKAGVEAAQKQLQASLDASREQFQGVADALKLDALGQILAMESEIEARRIAMTLIGHKLESARAELVRSRSSPGDAPTSTEKPKPSAAAKKAKKELEYLEIEGRIRVESYLAALDRLCFCTVKEYFKQDEWKIEYRDRIFYEVRTYPALFGADTRFPNILVLYERWRNE